jgi:hypothetical protein
MQEVVSACALEPACEAITLWGFTDNYTWINDNGDPDDPLLFDRNYEKKPAYTGFLSGLAGNAPALGENVLENSDFTAGTDPWQASNGELTVDAADGRDGYSACVTGRTDTSDALTRSDLLSALSGGGTFSFSAAVRLPGADSESVTATLTVEVPGQDPQELSLAGGLAGDSWFNLAGFFTVDFSAAAPSAIRLNLYGPPADVDLCAANVEIRPVSAP